MNMTDDEAKTKWCPFTRVVSVKGDFHRTDAYNRLLFDDDTVGTRCIGSDCMAWRESGKTFLWHKKEKREILAGEVTMIDETEIRHDDKGHCGMVGK